MYTDIHLQRGLFHDCISCYLPYICVLLLVAQVSHFPLLTVPLASRASDGCSASHLPTLLWWERSLSSSVHFQPWCHHSPNLPTSEQGAHSLPAWQKLRLAQGWAFWTKARETFKHVPNWITKQPNQEGTLGRERVTPSNKRWEDALLASHQSQ